MRIQASSESERRRVITFTVAMMLCGQLTEANPADQCSSPPLDFITKNEVLALGYITIEVERFRPHPSHPATIRVGVYNASQSEIRGMLPLRITFTDQNQNTVGTSMATQLIDFGAFASTRFGHIFCEPAGHEDLKIGIYVLDSNGDRYKQQPEVRIQTTMADELPETCDTGWNPEYRKVAQF